MQNSNAQTTPVLIAAFKWLMETDFGSLKGSGITVSFGILDGIDVVEPFALAAEDMEAIKVEILNSLIRSLRLRRTMLASESASIDTLIGLTIVN